MNIPGPMEEQSAAAQLPLFNPVKKIDRQIRTSVEVTEEHLEIYQKWYTKDSFKASREEQALWKNKCIRRDSEPVEQTIDRPGPKEEQSAAAQLPPKYVTPPHRMDEKEKRVRRRSIRFTLQQKAGELLPKHRVSYCQQRLIAGQTTVKIMLSEGKDGSSPHAHYKGLMTCGSVWVCPVCAAKITERRRLEVKRAIDLNPDKEKIFVTFTFSHLSDWPLERSLKVFLQAYRKLRAGDPYKHFEEKYGIVADIVGLEQTYGDEHGWHPHKHDLMFSVSKLTEDHVEEMRNWLSARWVKILASLGYYASDQYGVDVRIGDQAAGDYITKWGLDSELTKGPAKMGRKENYTPWQLLLGAVEGDQRAAALFVEYANAMKGKRLLTWSKGAREILGLNEPELTDEELAEQDQAKAVEFMAITKLQLDKVVKVGIRAELLSMAEQTRDAFKVWLWLGEFGIEALPIQLENSLAFKNTT